MTAWTIDGVFSLFLWQAQLIFAERALAKNVCFTMTEAIFLQLEPASDAREKACKGLVFALTLVNIFGEESEHRIRKQHKLRQGDPDAAHKEVDHHQSDRRQHQDVVKLIDSITPVHQSGKPHS